MLLISHANPEDNGFTLWLALRLAAEGYPIWCDLTQLLGGEVFWDDIEQAIRQRTAKFLYVLSRVSNRKSGPRKELRVAANVQRANKLKDFIIPLRIDDLSHAEVNIELSDINAIEFAPGWASGLSQLISKLEKDGVSKKTTFSRESVAEWWRATADPALGVAQKAEEYLSNWFQVQLVPDRLYFCHVRRVFSDFPKQIQEATFPAIGYKRFVLSFACEEDLAQLGLTIDDVITSQTLSVTQFLSIIRRDPLGGLAQRRRFLSWLLRVAWEQSARAKGLVSFELARGTAFFFTSHILPSDRASFRDVNDQLRSRALIGYRTVGKADGTRAKVYWHFGIEAHPFLEPFLGYTMHYHVAFSDDGIQLWDSPQKAHRARRRIGRHWWNAEWRDRLLAAVSWLCGDQDSLKVPVGSTTTLYLSKMPTTFASPVSYTVQEQASAAVDVDLEEDIDEDEDQWEPDEGGANRR